MFGTEPVHLEHADPGRYLEPGDAFDSGRAELHKVDPPVVPVGAFDRRPHRREIPREGELSAENRGRDPSMPARCPWATDFAPAQR